jgi:hypothetical protein
LPLRIGDRRGVARAVSRHLPPGRDDDVAEEDNTPVTCSALRMKYEEVMHVLLVYGRFRFHLGAFHELRSGNEVGALKQAGIDCEFRQQGGAETVVDHLH